MVEFRLVAIRDYGDVCREMIWRKLGVTTHQQHASHVPTAIVTVSMCANKTSAMCKALGLGLNLFM